MISPIITVEPAKISVSVITSLTSFSEITSNEEKTRTILFRTLRNPIQSPPRGSHSIPRPVQIRIQSLQQPGVHIQFIIYLQRQIPLTIYRMGKSVEMDILFIHELALGKNKTLVRCRVQMWVCWIRIWETRFRVICVRCKRTGNDMRIIMVKATI